MKKFLLPIILCITASAYALTKNDLEKSIRSLDVSAVQQILADEILTRCEYERYLNLAEEMVRGREIWTAKMYPIYDTATPYEGPSFKRLVPEAVVGWIGFKMAIYSVKTLLCMWLLPHEKKIFACGATIGSLVVGKVLYDLKKRFDADQAYKELLRKKYDDAITIKQLIYAANIYMAV